MVIPRARRIGAVLGLLVLLAAWGMRGGPETARAAPRSAAEYQVKAAFLYNFAKFVEWPAKAFAGPGDSFVIGVLGEDPFGAVLEETVRGKSVHEKPLVVKRFARVQDAVNSHVLFISSSEEGRLSQIVASLGHAPILTVGEMDRFAEQGGLIGLRVDAEKVRFDINLDAAQRTGLTMSSQLLKLARVVRDGSGKGN